MLIYFRNQTGSIGRGVKHEKLIETTFFLYEEGDSCSSPAMCNENVSLQKGMLPVIQGTITNYIVIKCTVIAWRIMFLANWSTSLCCSSLYRIFIVALHHIFHNFDLDMCHISVFVNISQPPLLHKSFLCNAEEGLF